MDPQAVSVIGFIYGFIPAAISIYRERTDERCTRGLFLKKTIKFSIWFVIIIYGIAELAKLTDGELFPLLLVLLISIIANYIMIYDYWQWIVKLARDAGYGKGFTCIGMIPVIFFLFLIFLLIVPGKKLFIEETTLDYK